MADYPTRIEDLTGERLWLTWFPETDPRAATPYEADYARWIPGNPFDALLVVFVFVAKYNDLSQMASAQSLSR